MKLMLYRTYLNEGTNGEIFNGATLVCGSIELPWKQNLANVSCIPEGTYVLKMRSTTRLGPHLQLIGVKDRKYILMHAANDALKELRGCIAPVTNCTGPGKGIGSKAELQKLLQLAATAQLQKENLVLTILNKEAEL